MASKADAIVLYDIPGNSPACKAWSSNTWRVRLALNYKGLPLRTEWVEYPDIEALYHKLGIEAASHREDGSPHYTLPVIHDPSTGKTIPDSFPIVKYLDDTYPNTPTLIPKSTIAFHRIFLSAWAPVSNSMWYIVVFAVYGCLNERSQPYFRETREKSEGRRLEDLRGEKEWQAAKTWFSRATQWLSANGEGADELVMGDRACFADLVIVSCFLWAKYSLGEDSEEWKRICSWDNGKWKNLVEKFAKYEVVDD